MQIFGDGPVQMLVVQCGSDLAMRATAKFADDLPEDLPFDKLINASGHGRCVITLDPANKQPGQQPYQGIVPLNGESGPLASMTEVLEQYMRHSEQLDTRLWLASDADRAVGLLLQKLPGDGGIKPRAEATDLDTWERVCTLANTLTGKEMLEIEPQQIFRRLFWQENVQHFDPATPRFQCTCSREKVGNMLKMLGKEEVDDVLAERGHVEIHCEYCNQRYDFDPIDVAQLFSPTIVAPSDDEQRH